MEQLIREILRAHPDFASEIKGVSEKEIRELEELCGISLPASYRAFLLAMGRDPGRIRPKIRTICANTDRTFYEHGFEVDIRYESVCKLLRHRKNMSEKKHNRLKRNLEQAGVRDLSRFLLIAVNPAGNDTGDCYLDLSSELLRVVEITETFGVIERSPSFMEFLFLELFRREVALRLRELNKSPA